MSQETKKIEQIQNKVSCLFGTIKKKSLQDRRRQRKSILRLSIMRKLEQMFIRDQEYQFGLTMQEIIDFGQLWKFQYKGEHQQSTIQPSQLNTILTKYSVDLSREVTKALKDVFGYRDTVMRKSVKGINVGYFPCLRIKQFVKQ